VQKIEGDIALPTRVFLPRMSSRTVTQNCTTLSNAAFNDAFSKFAPSAWMSFQKNSDIKAWAREEARRFVHTVPGATFLVTWYRLISYADAQLSAAEQKEKDAGVFPVKRTTPVAAASPSSSVDRATLNRILYREVTALWHAFQMEGYDMDENDVDVNGDSPVGVQRFIWHCAKVLARNQHATAESMVPLVQNWLQHARTSHPNAFAY